jgi:integrase
MAGPFGGAGNVVDLSAGTGGLAHGSGQLMVTADHTQEVYLKTLPTSARLPEQLTAARFQQLADVPPAITWFADIDNPQTRRAYQNDLREFMTFIGIAQPAQFRDVTRAHVLAWRKDLEKRALSGATIRRKLAALSSLFEYLCEGNAVTGNPVHGVERPRSDSPEGKTPAIGDHQARSLLDAPDPTTLQGQRDRAILVTQLYHGLRRAELCALTVADLQPRRGFMHLGRHKSATGVRYLMQLSCTRPMKGAKRRRAIRLGWPFYLGVRGALRAICQSL